MSASLFHLALGFSCLSFFAYGVACLTTNWMRREFERYRLARFRVVTGLLQLAGASGLFVGLFVPALGCLAAAGLSLQMLLGVGVRITIRDSLLQAIPAAFYCGLNGALCWYFWSGLFPAT